jgi:hypothetical protein
MRFFAALQQMIGLSYWSLSVLCQAGGQSD